MRLAVTGASGFVGGHLCAHLAASGIQVTAIDYRRLVEASDPRVPEGLQGAQALVHLAAIAHERAEALDQAREHEMFRRVNALGAEQLARQAAANGVEHFVFISTIQVCGDETHGSPFREDTVPRPRSVYARSKLEAEERLAKVARQTGLRLTVLRPTLVYGPGNGGNFLRLLRLVQRGWPLPFGAVRNRRSLTYVGNLVSAIAAVAQSRSATGVFIVCDSVPFSTPELVRGLAAAMRRRALLVPVPPLLLRAAARAVGRADTARRLLGSLEADPGRLQRTLAWSAPFSNDEGLRATAEWFATRQKAGR